MKIRRTAWKNWEAVVCRTETCELVVGVSAGPRILSLRYLGSDNLLYEDATDFRVGEWRLYGGHRFTVAPESGQSYLPDNKPCQVEIADSALRISAPVASNATQLSLVIRAAGRDGFDIAHVLLNCGQHAWQGALWAITCVPPTGVLLVPYPNGPIRHWPGTPEKRWKRTSDAMIMEWDGARGKVGWYSKPAWLRWVNPEQVFLIQTPDIAPMPDCVDEGCNLEVFTCKEYIELETLSGLHSLPPGAAAAYVQHWRLFPNSDFPKDMPPEG